MTSSAKRIRAYQGPALLSFGFRPFFLFAGIWAVLALCLWILMVTGGLTLPSHLAPADWHVHEMLYGYIPAVIAGFLLTAVPNWTGHLPITGAPLLALVLLWLAGRLVLFFSAFTGGPIAALIDASFLFALAAVIGREVIAGKNWRNLKVLVLLCLLGAGNVLYHVEAMQPGAAYGYGARLGTGAILFLIMLIGGRIIPSFTRNWLVKQKEGRLPVPFNRFDIAAMVAAGIALLSWIALPFEAVTAWLCLIAGLFHLLRLARWAGERSFAEPLVSVLHAGYLFVPLGFFALAAAHFFPAFLFYGDGLHAWTIGAMGVMTLAVMSRAALGHTGRPLTAGIGLSLVYILIIAAALARLFMSISDAPQTLLYLSAFGWIGGFGGFVVLFAPLLAAARKGKAG